MQNSTAATAIATAINEEIFQLLQARTLQFEDVLGCPGCAAITMATSLTVQLMVFHAHITNPTEDKDAFIKTALVYFENLLNQAITHHAPENDPSINPFATHKGTDTPQ